ncbi:MAG: hypothetical protein IID15_04250, partial [Candidatus Marinimicrobia bacterium]|nr:hypothetical protein [Candidatus Neomarinimicrobiota bacterium]
MARREIIKLIEGLPWLKSRRTVRLAMWVGTVLTISWLYPLGGQFEFRYDLNEITREAVISPFNFPVLKRANILEDERELARQSVPLLFRREAKISVDQKAGLVSLFSLVRGVQQSEKQLEKSRANAFRHRFDDQAESSQQAVTQDSIAVVTLKGELAQQFPLDLSSSQWGAIFSGETEDERTLNVGRLERNLERIIRDVISEGVLELSKRQIGESAVAVSSGGVEEILELEFLMDRDEAWAKAIARQVEARTMPPWFATAEFHGVFSNERTLTDDEILTIIDWVQTGAPRGKPLDAPAEASFAETETDGWSIGEPDLVLAMEPFFVEDDVVDLNISFTTVLTDQELPEGRWVQAIEYKAGSE